MAVALGAPLEEIASGNALSIIPHHFAQRQGGGEQFSMVKATKKLVIHVYFAKGFWRAGKRSVYFLHIFSRYDLFLTEEGPDFAERCLLSQIEVLKWRHPNQRRSF